MRTLTKQISASKSIGDCKKFLAARGYVVAAGNMYTNGHDIVAIRENKYVTIEVKTATYSARAWKTSKLCSHNSDMVCVVFPCGYCLLEDMKHYIKTAAKSGEKCYTQLGNLLNEMEK